MPNLRRLLALGCLLAPAHTQQPVVAGRVLDRTGEPAANATLTLRWRMAPELPGLCGISLGDRGVGELVAGTRERGAFKLTLPHRGPFELTAAAGGDRSVPEFPVMAGAFVELHLEPAVSVGGRAVDADGQAVANVAVALVPELTAWNKLAAYRLPEARHVTSTDADGSFTMPFHAGYLRSPRWEPFVLLDFARDGVACANLELLRPTEHCRNLQLQLVPAAQAHPRAPRSTRKQEPVVRDPRSCRVRLQLQRQGRALADSDVLWSSPVADGPPVERSTRSDAIGQVESPPAAPGTWWFGFVRVDDTWLPCCRRQTGDEDVDLGSVEVAARRLRGQVLDASGQPIAGARVATMTRAALTAKELPYVTWSDHGGRFEFAAVPAGPLHAWADCGTLGFASGVVDATDTATLRASTDGEVEGVAVDSDGKPVAGAWLVLVHSGDDTLMPGLRPGTTFLCVRVDSEGRVRVQGLPLRAWQVIGNVVVDGRLMGGSTQVQTGGTFSITLREQRG